jgi:hypothetical protein
MNVHYQLLNGEDRHCSQYGSGKTNGVCYADVRAVYTTCTGYILVNVLHGG